MKTQTIFDLLESERGKLALSEAGIDLLRVELRQAIAVGRIEPACREVFTVIGYLHPNPNAHPAVEALIALVRDLRPEIAEALGQALGRRGADGHAKMFDQPEERRRAAVLGEPAPAGSVRAGNLMASLPRRIVR